jgi:hypothetical protein
MPSDVFQALDEIDYGFMRDRVEAEFARMLSSSRERALLLLGAWIGLLPCCRDAPHYCSDSR